MIEVILYYFPYLSYRHNDKDLTRAWGTLMVIIFIYFFPVFIYLTHSTDCFYFIEKPGEYYRRHPVTLVLCIPILVIVTLFFQLNKKKILKKFEAYEQDFAEHKRRKKKTVVGVIIITLVYLVSFFTLLFKDVIPPIWNCW